MTMATERLPMRTIREVLRLKWLPRRSHRETARSLGISAGAVASVVTRAPGLGLTWAAVEPLSEDDLDRRLHGPRLPAQASRAEPDPFWVQTELRRKEGEGAPGRGDRLSQFRKASMRSSPPRRP